MSAAVAIISALAARGRDEDEALLISALEKQGAQVSVVPWDADRLDHPAGTIALLRSTWDYQDHLPSFLAWAAEVSARARLENPLPVVRWNTDKHYLADLAQLLTGGQASTARPAILPPDGPVIPGAFIEPGDDGEAALAGLLARHPASPQVVVKPAVGAGSRGVQRHAREAIDAITTHIRQLHETGMSVLLQPYLGRVEGAGETALIYLDGIFSHAVRKGPILPPGGTATQDLFAREDITRRIPAADERALGERVIAALGAVPALQGLRPPLYARVDLLRDDQGAPRLLELELCEPSLFLAHAPGAAERFARAVLERVTTGIPG